MNEQQHRQLPSFQEGQDEVRGGQYHCKSDQDNVRSGSSKAPPHNLNYLKPYRKELRNNSTPVEAILWRHLKGKLLAGRKFRRQHSINNYIVDFFCYAENIIIEIDGDVHLEVAEKNYDEQREEELSKLGFRIIRYTNEDIFNNIESVLQDIKSNFTTPIPSLKEGS